MNLSAFKNKPLQHIAFLTGVPSTGTKSYMINQLQTSLGKSRLPSNGGRILSVDMGIRNLAYCVMDVPANSHTTKDKLHVHAWKRLDLLQRLKSNGIVSELESSGLSSKSGADAPETVAKTILKDSFTPSVMSKLALNVAQDFLKYKPDTILIERQRFRSGGGSAIQEWTVRVNTLESMLWACFETLRSMESQQKRGGAPALYEVGPKRVADFWTASSEAHLPLVDIYEASYAPPELKAASTKVKSSADGKRQKIAVLQSWLDGSGGISLDFSPETQKTAATFAPGPKRSRPKKGKDDGSEETTVARETKLDDLADCLLQGAAWVRWEENRRAILEAAEMATNR